MMKVKTQYFIYFNTVLPVKPYAIKSQVGFKSCHTPQSADRETSDR